MIPLADFLRIDPEQKLIAHPLRTRILHATAERPMTAKQTATALGETPGNVHYHLQRLLAGGLVEITETRTVKGITEKYYKARSTRFHGVPEGVAPGPYQQIEGFIAMTDEESDRMILELAEVLHRWEQAMAGPARKGASARYVRFTVSPAPEADA